MKYRGDVTEIDCKKIVMEKHRWYVKIIITKEDNTIVTYVASADGGFTDGNHIFFDTIEGYNEYCDENDMPFSKFTESI